MTGHYGGNEMRLRERAAHYYFTLGKSCAEGILWAANDLYDLKLTEGEVQLFAGFRTGMGCGSTCGGLTGAIGVLSRMYGSLLVAHQYVMQRILVVVQGIVGGHYGTTGISEEHVHALVFEGAHKGFSTCYLCCFQFLSFIRGGYKRI